MSQFKVVITDFGQPDNTLEEEELRASGLDIELVRLNVRTPEELVPHVHDADGLIVQWVKINGQVMDAMPKCRVISRYGIGVDMVDIPAATAHGIMVCNVPDFSIDEVSTHTLAFLLALNRHLIAHHHHVRAGKWNAPPGPPSRLAGQTLGIVGVGNIGSAVARKACGFGLELLGYDPYVAQDKLHALGIESVGLDELLRRSDYVTLHCPLTPETRHLISQPQFAQMKPTAYLINMARGPIVDQAALYHALVNGTIKGAALDVLEQEPPSPDDPLLQLDNVILTPHSSSWSADSIVQLRRDAARNVVTALQGKLPRSIVNRKELGLPGA